MIFHRGANAYEVLDNSSDIPQQWSTSGTDKIIACDGTNDIINSHYNKTDIKHVVAQISSAVQKLQCSSGWYSFCTYNAPRDRQIPASQKNKSAVRKQQDGDQNPSSKTLAVSQKMTSSNACPPNNASRDRPAEVGVTCCFTSSSCRSLAVDNRYISTSE